MTRQETIDQLENEFGLELERAAALRVEPDYEYLGERFLRVSALIDVRDGRSKDIQL
jgi:hypothetical protein